MTDCTRARPKGLASGRGGLRVVVCAAALALAVLAYSTDPARADGDPASDVLTTQTLFLPQDAGISGAQLRELGSLLQAAANGGLPLRVALIASPTDLGSVTELWRQPETYARFLGEELSLTYRGRLLVIMPNGFGVFDQGLPVTAAQAVLRGLRLAAPGPGLGATALTAIRRVAAVSGHPLALPAAVTTTRGRSGDSASWIAFLAGVVLIALAWVASLRARPLGSEAEKLPAA
jgi:hypothetical protein